MRVPGHEEQQGRTLHKRRTRRAALRAGGLAAALAAGACAERSVPAPEPAAAFASGPASCAAVPDPRFERTLAPGTLDPALADRAIRFHANRARCAAGRAPLAAAPPLAEAAAMQARDMAASAIEVRNICPPPSPRDPSIVFMVFPPVRRRQRLCAGESQQVE